jgi:hypothetical protein
VDVAVGRIAPLHWAARASTGGHFVAPEILHAISQCFIDLLSPLEFDLALARIARSTASGLLGLFARPPQRFSLN